MKINIKNIRIAIVAGILLSLTGVVNAQQLPVYSQYMMNKFLINPAVAGSEGYTAVNITTRKQWMGIKDAPLTFAASAQTRILQNSFISKGQSILRKNKNSSREGRVGVGGYIFDDRHGLVGRSGLQLTYAYHIRMEDSQLSFGLSGTFWQFRLDRQNARLLNPDDDLFNTMDNAMFIPDANVGVYYSSAEYYVGLSADQLFQSSMKFGGTGYEKYKLYRHFYLMGGYNFEVTDDIILEPSAFMKLSQLGSFQLDLTAKAYFYQDYWAGISYRTGSALILIGGVKVDKFYFGYAFDFTFTSMMSHTYGTHEIMVAMKFGDSARRFRWLQRF